MAPSLKKTGKPREAGAHLRVDCWDFADCFWDSASMRPQSQTRRSATFQATPWNLDSVCLFRFSWPMCSLPPIPTAATRGFIWCFLRHDGGGLRGLRWKRIGRGRPPYQDYAFGQRHDTSCPPASYRLSPGNSLGSQTLYFWRSEYLFGERLITEENFNSIFWRLLS